MTDWQTRFDELIDNEWWTIDDPDARSMTRTTSKIKQFLAQELSTLETKHRAEVEEAVEQAVQAVITELRKAIWQEKETVHGRVVEFSEERFLKAFKLARKSLTTTTSERKDE